MTDQIADRDTTDTTSTEDTMTERAETTTDDTTTDETTATDTTTAEQAEADTEQAEQQGKAGREAARYRTRLREAEADRDRLTGQVEALQRAEAERIAGQTIAKPNGLWAAGVTLDALLTEDGNVDPNLVQKAANQAAESLGLAAVRRNYVPREGGTTRSGRGSSRMEDMIGG